MSDTEMIVVKLQGKDARMWRETVEMLGLDEDVELYEELVGEVFRAGLFEFNKYMMGNMSDEDVEMVQQELEGISHVLVLHNHQLGLFANNSPFVTVLPEGVLIAYKEKQELDEGNIFFLPDGEGLVIPRLAIIEDEVEVDFSGAFQK